MDFGCVAQDYWPELDAEADAALENLLAVRREGITGNRHIKARTSDRGTDYFSGNLG